MTAHCNTHLQRHVAEGGLREQLQQDLEQVGLKDVAQRHPGEVDRQRVQRGADEVRL